MYLAPFYLLYFLLFFNIYFQFNYLQPSAPFDKYNCFLFIRIFLTIPAIIAPIIIYTHDTLNIYVIMIPKRKTPILNLLFSTVFPISIVDFINRTHIYTKHPFNADCTKLYSRALSIKLYIISITINGAIV